MTRLQYTVTKTATGRRDLAPQLGVEEGSLATGQVSDPASSRRLAFIVSKGGDQGPEPRSLASQSQEG
jgi:hypothetical protein